MNRRRLLIAAQGLVSVTLLALLLRSVDLNALPPLFRRLPVWFYLASLFVVLAGQVVYAWRWRLLLVAAGARAPWSSVVRQHFIGLFLNNFLPSMVGGDVAKVYLLGRDHGYRVVTASVLLDRMLGLALLAACATLTLWSVALGEALLVSVRLVVTGVAAASLLVLAVAALGTGGLPARAVRLGPRVVAIAERLQRLRLDMAAALTSPVVIAQALLIVVTYFLGLGFVYVTYIGMQMGVAPPFAVTTGVVMAIAVLSNIPVSLNGLGLREQLHAVLLAGLGVPPAVAVAISLLMFGHLLVASLIGFVFWTQIGPVAVDLTAPLQS